MVKYFAEDGWRAGIECVDVERETDSSFWSEGNCRRKETRDSKLFDSFDEAKEYLIERHSQKVNSAEYRLSEARKRLDNVKAIKLQ